MAEATGLSYRQVDHWVRCGWLVPEGEVHPGSGRRRGFADQEVLVAGMMAHLVAAGLQPSAAAPIARELAMTGRATFGGLTGGLQVVLRVQAVVVPG